MEVIMLIIGFLVGLITGAAVIAVVASNHICIKDERPGDVNTDHVS